MSYMINILTMASCYFCGAELDLPVYRSSECPSCGRDVKICMNCEFYSGNSHWQCRESITEPVVDKERANYCDYFRPGNNNRAEQESKDALDAFKKLFGD